ncbi:nucleoside triphosphate pyrophosphohydrolase [Prosthecochloris sp. ZM_2]|uniref:nucleoside triphosphate pyrophosphohydrolase n=1 Tax=Prosthecochloris sp. ZM_2 TaxID=2045206 RepID=UPI000DF7879D|nr:nucleoside triphosphate pyrophosphohydrolase [Prosthecochloris sp. ZM_2]RNA66438.1 nucleoside triphosphate pyrophosphohydrolase [Prosthecochloris sp. ZM_2]
MDAQEKRTIAELRDEVASNPGSTLHEKFERVINLVKVLRSECPWDRKQTPSSLAHLLLEESYELVHAIDEDDDHELKKELGDLFLHVTFQAVMAEEAGRFRFPDVFDALCNKLISRHPHVFAETPADSEQEVLKNWESLKLKEKGRRGLLDGVPNAMSELLRAYRVQKKVAGVGFDWDTSDGVLDKLVEEIAELRDASTPEEQEAEFGDLLFTIVNFSRHLHANPEDALRKATNRFMHRFNLVEQMVRQSGRNWREFSPDELDEFWERAKNQR